MIPCQTCRRSFEPLGALHRVCRDCFREAKRQEFAESQTENDRLRSELAELKAEKSACTDAHFGREIVQTTHLDRHDQSALSQRVTQHLLNMRGRA